MRLVFAKLACFLLGACLVLEAQNTAGTASISGTVIDPSGSAVPGASVVVENPSKGIRRELSTTDSGVFNVPALVPAPGYTVNITKPGFARYEVKDVALTVGSTVNLNASLSVSSSATQVEVTSEAPIVDTVKPDVSQLVSSRQILDLPINGRRVDNFVLLTPGVTSDAGFGLLTFRGLPGGNSFLTDGVDTTNSFYDENAGRTRTYNISQDAVQEFQVITSGSLAEYGRASGGVVNTITRSGTNEFHGTAYEFFRNRTLNATDISSFGAKPQDWRHQAGASIGGPIKRDKLFFFFNGELQRRYFPIASSNVQNSNLFTSPTTINPRACGAPATAAQCSAAEQYIIGRAEPQLVPRTADVNLLFGKIDYQINDRNRASFEFNYVDFRSPNGIQTQIALINGNAVGNNANTTVFDRTGKASITTIVSANIVNEAKFGFFKDRQYDPNSPSLLPSIGPIGLSISGATAISNIGYATGYNRLDPSEQRFQFGDTLSYTLGRHNVKFGVDYDNVEDYVSLLSNRYGTYTYASLTNFALDFSGNTTLAKNWATYSQKFGNPVVDTSLNEISAFIQDEWHITPKLTISPGLRYEKAFLPQPIEKYSNLVNPLLPQTDHIPQTSRNFAPRFGFAYAVNSKTVLRGDYGLFWNRYVTAAISNFFTANGFYQATYTLSATGSTGPRQVAAGPVFPYSLTQQPTAVPGAATPSIPDPAFRPSYSEQGDFAIERQLTSNSSVTLSYIWDRALHLISAFDANVATPTQNYTYPILNAQNQVVGTYTTPIYTRRLNPAFGSIIDVTSSNNSYYNGFAVQYNKRYSSWFQGQASYTYSHAEDYNVGGGGNTLFTPSSPTSVFNGNYANEKGSSSTDQRHRLVANGVATPKFVRGNSAFDRYLINNWELSAITTAASAQPLVPTVSVSAAPSSLLNRSTLNGLGGSSRVPFEPISGLDADQLYRTDARLSKTLPFSERFKVTLIFEAFNVFNHHYYAGTNPRTTQQYSTVNYNLNGQSVIELAPFASYGAWGTTSSPLEGTTARRAQVAVRITW
ncbi:MAG: TonB-dependent receptor [Acidobacteriota bacterium]|nr:TonB-dependent receptor [Acidobacteriota bacterium]